VGTQQVENAEHAKQDPENGVDMWGHRPKTTDRSSVPLAFLVVFEKPLDVAVAVAGMIGSRFR
jgi:hypothetical protein